MTIQLIVNADDYGYFPCVSRGIVESMGGCRNLTATDDREHLPPTSGVGQCRFKNVIQDDLLYVMRSDCFPASSSVGRLVHASEPEGLPVSPTAVWQ